MGRRKGTIGRTEEMSIRPHWKGRGGTIGRVVSLFEGLKERRWKDGKGTTGRAGRVPFEGRRGTIVKAVGPDISRAELYHWKSLKRAEEHRWKGPKGTIGRYNWNS